MSQVNKSGGVNDPLKRDPVLDYRVWSQPTESDEERSLRPLQIRQASEGEAELASDSMLGTVVFLVALVVIGLIAGYTLRGNAYAGANRNATYAMAIGGLETTAGLETNTNRSKLVATFGSTAPDQLLAFNPSIDGRMTSLVRLHDTSGAGIDSISLLSIAENGAVEELSRVDATDMRASDMATLADGQLVTASLRAGTIGIEGLNSEGRQRWTHTYEAPDNHLTDVKIVAVAGGTATVGPSQQLDRVRLTYLGLDGELIWQRSFLTDSEDPQSWLEAAADGTVLLAVRNPAGSSEASHTLMRIDGMGRDVWTVSVDIDESGTLSGLAGLTDGGAYLLTTGPISSLTRYDSTGGPAWDVLVPQAQHFNDVHLLATVQGDAIIATSYALGHERLDVWVEQRDRNGDLSGETSLSLPGLSSVDAISEASPGRYLFAGSIMPGQFEDSDVFIKSFDFKPVSRPAEYIAVATAPEPAPTQIASLEDAVMDNQIDTVLADTNTSALPEEVVEIAEQVTTPAVISVVEAAPATVDAPDASSENVIGVSGFNTDGEGLTSVPMDGEKMLTAQCRFSCLEAGSATESFPMWRAITASKGDFDTGLNSLHTLTCQAAGGRINPTLAPDCGGF